MMTRSGWIFLVLAGWLVTAGGARAAVLDWSDTELQGLYGQGFKEPGEGARLSRGIVTFQHADGYALGRNFLFVDTIVDQGGAPQYARFYGEGYSYLSLSKLSGAGKTGGRLPRWLADLELDGGVNLGSGSGLPGPLVYLYGVCVDFRAPGFAFLNLEILRHEQRRPQGATGASMQLTLSWKREFRLLGERFSFEGFMDHIGAKGPGTATQIVSQPQLRWDAGAHWGAPGRLWIGCEYQFWRNKYGIQGFNEHLPQALVVWTL